MVAPTVLGHNGPFLGPEVHTSARCDPHLPLDFFFFLFFHPTSFFLTAPPPFSGRVGQQGYRCFLSSGAIPQVIRFLFLKSRRHPFRSARRPGFKESQGERAVKFLGTWTTSFLLSPRISRVPSSFVCRCKLERTFRRTINLLPFPFLDSPKVEESNS